MDKLVSIGKAAKMLGVTIQTMRNWDRSGKLKPDDITRGGSRSKKNKKLIEDMKEVIDDSFPEDKTDTEQ